MLDTILHPILGDDPRVVPALRPEIIPPHRPPRSGEQVLRRLKAGLRGMKWWRKPKGLRQQLAARYLKGSGLEIGALHNRLWVPRGVQVKYVDRLSVADLRRQYPELAGHPLIEADLLDDGEKLTTVPDGSQDFLIANHFLEHTQDPIGTLKRHLEVLKPNGILYLAVPDKRWTFDARRPVTTLEHLYRDYEEGPECSYQDHYQEWVELVENLQEPRAAAERVRQLITMSYSIHYHVWTQWELLELLFDVRRRLHLPFEIETVVLNHRRRFAESVAILRKT